MFTGIVQAVGKLRSLEDRGDDRRFHIEANALDLTDVRCGDSICVSGVCLTVLNVGATNFSTDVSVETLASTTFSRLAVGDAVNLEKALTPTTALGGHFVNGHADGVGEIVDWRQAGRSIGMRVRTPANLAKYIAQKGSVCIDGISFTVNDVQGPEFEINVIPHTLEHTTAGSFTIGREINLEVDIIARYLESLLRGDEEAVDSKVTAEFLTEHGFIRDS
ncbi:MAG: riboflavin synthase [Gammaproteobacteria bacterium]|jgi:riboflavin synthase|nr:riboflavin synthase [Gammaproteobacteria bacterium]